MVTDEFQIIVFLMVKTIQAQRASLMIKTTLTCRLKIKISYPLQKIPSVSMLTAKILVI